MAVLPRKRRPLWLAIISAVALAVGGVLLSMALDTPSDYSSRPHFAVIPTDATAPASPPPPPPQPEGTTQPDVTTAPPAAPISPVAPLGTLPVDGDSDTADIITATAGAVSALGGLCGGIAAVITARHARQASSPTPPPGP